jgi:type VI secretion system protein ImpF
MRYAPSLLDKLMQRTPAARAGEAMPGLSLDEVKDSVAADLESLLNTRSAMADDDMRRYPLSSAAVLNYGVPDFASRSLSSGLDRDFICLAIQRAIERHDARLRTVQVSLEPQAKSQAPVFNRLNFTIRAVLRLSDIGEQVSFDARFEPALQRYSVARRSRAV